MGESFQEPDDDGHGACPVSHVIRCNREGHQSSRNDDEAEDLVEHLLSNAAWCGFARKVRISVVKDAEMRQCERTKSAEQRECLSLGVDPSRASR